MKPKPKNVAKPPSKERNAPTFLFILPNQSTAQAVDEVPSS